MTDGWHVGRKDILRFLEKNLGVSTWKTVKQWKKKGDIIIRYLPNGKPFIIEREVMTQKLKQSDLILKILKKGTP